DHLSIDTKQQRLFVAALGNNTVEVIDLKAGKLAHSMPGLSEPQGVLYVPAVDRLFVANAKDGTVRMFDGTSFKLLKTISYGEDADNLRLDSASGTVYVGYGSGALGAIDKDGGKIGDIRLDAHPESFQLEKEGPRIFVNLPKSRKIAVVNRKTGAVTATWNTGGPQQNYPMALDEANHRLFVVCRSPARLVVLDTNSGKIIQTLPASGDCDDVFYDQARTRLYATGGDGAISVFQQDNADHYTEVATIKTVRGARTGFFSPELGRLYVAARRQGAQPAAIRVYEAQR
ncbi:MAG: YncE family protein, partial [Acidobacteriota bacterium]|nr:YncE family protein [Acidobacteriota bacterium]